MCVFLIHTVHSVEKRKIWSHQKYISSNQLLSDFFSKNVTFTNFLPKMCETKLLERKFQILHAFEKTFVKLRQFISSNIIRSQLISRRTVKFHFLAEFMDIFCLNLFEFRKKSLVVT